MKVHEAMTSDPRRVSPQDTIYDVAVAMKEEGTGFVPVCEGDTAVGVITDRDIVLRCLAEGHADPLANPRPTACPATY
jgi:CBS domain-containing protein